MTAYLILLAAAVAVTIAAERLYRHPGTWTRLASLARVVAVYWSVRWGNWRARRHADRYHGRHCHAAEAAAHLAAMTPEAPAPNPRAGQAPRPGDPPVRAGEVRAGATPAMLPAPVPPPPGQEPDAGDTFPQGDPVTLPGPVSPAGAGQHPGGWLGQPPLDPVLRDAWRLSHACLGDLVQSEPHPLQPGLPRGEHPYPVSRGDWKETRPIEAWAPVAIVRPWQELDGPITVGRCAGWIAARDYARTAGWLA